MGVFGNGRFFEALIKKSQCHSLSEMQDVGKKSVWRTFKSDSIVCGAGLIRITKTKSTTQISLIRLQQISSTPLQRTVVNSTLQEKQASDSSISMSKALSMSQQPCFYEKSNCSLKSLREHCAGLSPEALSQILEISSAHRKNRRHKSPRALEHATFTFEICADYGIYRDLQRHRILTQEKQKLTCDYSYYTPREIEGTELEEKYHAAMAQAKQAYDLIAAEFPEEAQYVVPMAYNIRWYFHVKPARPAVDL